MSAQIPVGRNGPLFLRDAGCHPCYNKELCWNAVLRRIHTKIGRMLHEKTQKKAPLPAETAYDGRVHAQLPAAVPAAECREAAHLPRHHARPHRGVSYHDRKHPPAHRADEEAQRRACRHPRRADCRPNARVHDAGGNPGAHTHARARRLPQPLAHRRAGRRHHGVSPRQRHAACPHGSAL